uniref:Secreted protein n=1 Tax=Heterorhabditis bacteriophora TaxID=37862 RepID=A0A1I7WSZ5_HETBA
MKCLCRYAIRVCITIFVVLDIMTSVESLLSEVSTILRSRLTIKAADEAFFGGKQVYTNIPILATSSVVSTGGSNKVFAEIANLKKENMAIREELVQLRKLIEQMNICKEKRLKAYAEKKSKKVQSVDIVAFNKI